MVRRRVDQLKVAQQVVWEGKNAKITNLEMDGDIHVITLDDIIVLRRTAGAKFELAKT